MNWLKKIKARNVFGDMICNFFNKLIVRQTLIGVIFSVLLFILIVINVAPEKISVSIGEFAPRDIRVTKDIVDQKATKELKKEAREKVEPRHIIDLSIQVKARSEIKNFFQLLYKLKNNSKENLKIQDKLNLLKEDLNVKLSKENYLILLDNDLETLKKLESYVTDITSQVMSTGVKAEELKYERENVNKIFDNLDDLNEDIKNVGKIITNSKIQPNRFLDVETTEDKKQEAANNVAPVILKQGQIIVREGEKINSSHLDLIRKTGLLKESEGIELSVGIGSLLIVLMFLAVVIVYMYFLNKEILRNCKQLTILSIIVLSILVISKPLYGISEYLIPIATASMLISILVDARLSVLINVIISLILGLITKNDINLMVICIVGGTIGAIGVVKTSQRHNIFLVGLIVSIANVITIISFGLINDIQIKIILIKSLYGILNGVFAAILTIGSLPLWESLFNIVTPLKLLELSNPNHPLLKKLLLEAPGTYHHSIVVGNLSEAAAEAVKGNTLVARVGAYYHDVGKLKRPYFFKENQLSGVNPHDKLNPNLSTLIITSHIKDGIEMASKYRLPQMIKDIIREHHGTTLVAYFYHKAISGENADLIQEESFRYNGPKPQSKEAAIIMLADSVEAAVRSIQEASKGKIEGLVRKIISDKLGDGQLDECHLTLKDLDTIANSFVNILLGIFHDRVEYPKLDLSELKGGN